jgi:hypothetical protein
VAVDAARKHQPAGGIDFLEGASDAGPDGGNPAVHDADVGADRGRFGHHEAVPDDEIES